MNWEDYLYYDETSSTHLRWRIDMYRGRDRNVKFKAAGDEAGWCVRGSWRVCVNGTTWYLHRVVWHLHNGEIPQDYVVDHIDGNTENNSIANLRAVTKSVNQQNKRKHSNNKTGVTGVSLSARTDSYGNTRYYYNAKWTQAGKEHNKYFSVDNLGNEEAFRQACEFRDEKIKELNACGECYSERHGT